MDGEARTDVSEEEKEWKGNDAKVSPPDDERPVNLYSNR